MSGTVEPYLKRRSIYFKGFDPSLTYGDVATDLKVMFPDSLPNFALPRDRNTQCFLGNGYANFYSEEECARQLAEWRFKLRIGGSVVRMMQAVDSIYKDEVFGPAGSRFMVVVKNISADMDEETLFNYFSVFGEVFLVTIHVDYYGQATGLVQFVELDSVQLAIAHANNKAIPGFNTIITVFQHNNNRPARDYTTQQLPPASTDFPSLSSATTTASALIARANAPSGTQIRQAPAFPPAAAALPTHAQRTAPSGFSPLPPPPLPAPLSTLSPPTAAIPAPAPPVHPPPPPLPPPLPIPLPLPATQQPLPPPPLSPPLPIPFRAPAQQQMHPPPPPLPPPIVAEVQPQQQPLQPPLPPPLPPPLLVAQAMMRQPAPSPRPPPALPTPLPVPLPVEAAEHVDDCFDTSASESDYAAELAAAVQSPPQQSTLQYSQQPVQHTQRPVQDAQHTQQPAQHTQRSPPPSLPVPLSVGFSGGSSEPWAQSPATSVASSAHRDVHSASDPSARNRSDLGAETLSPVQPDHRVHDHRHGNGGDGGDCLHYQQQQQHRPLDNWFRQSASSQHAPVPAPNTTKNGPTVFAAHAEPGSVQPGAAYEYLGGQLQRSQRPPVVNGWVEGQDPHRLGHGMSHPAGQTSGGGGVGPDPHMRHPQQQQLQGDMQNPPHHAQQYHQYQPQASHTTQAPQQQQQQQQQTSSPQQQQDPPPPQQQQQQMQQQQQQPWSVQRQQQFAEGMHSAPPQQQQPQQPQQQQQQQQQPQGMQQFAEGMHSAPPQPQQQQQHQQQQQQPQGMQQNTSKPLPGQPQGLRRGLRHHLNAAVSQLHVIEQAMCCPITDEELVDPVVAADGYTYERRAIELWLQGHDSSPMSNAPLPHKQVLPNHLVRTLLQSLGR